MAKKTVAVKVKGKPVATNTSVNTDKPQRLAVTYHIKPKA